MKKNIIFVSAVLFITTFLYSNLMWVDRMEPRNYMTAKEILENGTWLLPTLEGQLRIAKPPLPTWITALVMMETGTDTNLVANRIPAGICALFLVLFTALIAKRILGDKGFAFTTLLVLATTPLFMMQARFNEWDIYAHTFMAGAIWALLEAFMREKGKNKYFLFFSVFMALSFYGKGPVAFWSMLLTFLISYFITFGTKNLKENQKALILSVALCVFISALWPAYAYLHSPHYALNTANTVVHSWFTTGIEPAWFYVAFLPVIAGVWLPLLLYGLVSAFLDKKWKPEERLFAYWFILTLVFHSLFPEKYLRYILPAVVPGAIVTTIVIYRLRESGGWAWKGVYGAFCFITAALFMVAAAALVYYSKSIIPAVGGAVAIGGAGAVLIYAFVSKDTINTHITAIVGVCLCVIFLPPVAWDRLGPDDARRFMHVRDNPILKNMDFCTTRLDLQNVSFPYDIRWALNKKIHLVTDYTAMGLMTKRRVEPFALITKYKPGHQPAGSRLADTIVARYGTYYIYLVPGIYPGN
jgi:4-amino-4-deoxy-L-arabinose transferase-like glycosyltransferase